MGSCDAFSTVLGCVCGLLSPLVNNECRHICDVENIFQDLVKELHGAEELLERIDGSQEGSERVMRLRRLCLEVEDVIYKTKRLITELDPQMEHRNGVRYALHPLGHGWSFIRNITKPGKVGRKLEEVKTEKNRVQEIQQSNNNCSQGLKGATVRCFHYFSLFPQESQFDKEDLIWLWIGAGLVNDTSNFQELKDATRECFNELSGTYLQELLANTNSGPQMYEFTHSFAQSPAPKIYLSLSERSVDALHNRNLCHLSVAQNILPNHQKDIKLRKCLRTFISIDSNQHGRLTEIQADLFSKMKKLRVLVLKNTYIVDVPYIRELKRLRLLDISETLVKSLPKLTLPNLQILKLKKNRRHCQSFTNDEHVLLPDNFSKMTSLVYVDWDVSFINSCQPDNIGSLINLETLPLFVVTNKKGHRITELEKMNRLQNSLRITKLEAVQNEEDAKKARISMKTALQSLELEWNEFPEGEIAKEVLSGLQPYSGLKELHVVNYGLDSYPSWFSEPSFKLEKIHLENCSSCNLLRSFGQLSALEVLHLEGMHNLESMDDLLHRTSEDSTRQYFKKLKSLVLSSMEDLRDWKKLGTDDMPQLEKLEIKGCPNLNSLPPLENLTSLWHIEIDKCEELSSLPEPPSTLQSLIIKASNLLASQCQPQGEVWPKLGNLRKLAIDDQPIELPPTISSETERSPFQQTSTSPLTESFEHILSGNATSLTDQLDNSERHRSATGAPVICDNVVQIRENCSGMNGPGIADYEKGKGKLDDTSHYTHLTKGDSSNGGACKIDIAHSNFHNGESSVKCEVAPPIANSADESVENLAFDSGSTSSEISPSNQHCNEHGSCGLGDSIPEWK